MNKNVVLLGATALTLLVGCGDSDAGQNNAPTVIAQVQLTPPVTVTPSPTVVVAPGPPPAPQPELVPPPPSASISSYWQPGHWNWSGSNWVWVEGEYIQRSVPPIPTAVWVQGQWVAQPTGGYAWIEGHWQN